MMFQVVFVPVPVSGSMPVQIPAMLEQSNCKTMSPTVQKSFNKSRMCRANAEGRSRLGANCRFAHSQEELVSMPNLDKTKLCFDFFR